MRIKLQGEALKAYTARRLRIRRQLWEMYGHGYQTIAAEKIDTSPGYLRQVLSGHGISAPMLDRIEALITAKPEQ